MVRGPEVTALSTPHLRDSPPSPSPFPTVPRMLLSQVITNPYGRTKYMMEEVLRDLQRAHPDMGVVLLRYFNPVGAHKSGRIGEDPQGIPNNLMPFIQQVRTRPRTRVVSSPSINAHLVCACSLH